MWAGVGMEQEERRARCCSLHYWPRPRLRWPLLCSGVSTHHALAAAVVVGERRLQPEDAPPLDGGLDPVQRPGHRRRRGAVQGRADQARVGRRDDGVGEGVVGAGGVLLEARLHEGALHLQVGSSSGWMWQAAMVQRERMGWGNAREK